jgi:hypothetical protein
MNEYKNEQTIYLSLTFIMIIILIKILDFINIYRYKKEIKHQKIINDILLKQIDNIQFKQNSYVKFYYTYLDYKSCPKEFIIQYPIKR